MRQSGQLWRMQAGAGRPPAFLERGSERMRKCIRCDAGMLEDLEIRATMNADTLRVCRAHTTGMMKKNYFGGVRAAVCPQCGYLETYVADLEQVQKNMTGK